MRFVKRLFCKHEYEFVNQQMIDELGRAVVDAKRNKGV